MPVRSSRLIAGLLLVAGAATATELPPPRLIEELAEAQIPVPGDWSVFGFDALWVTDRSRLYRVDPRDNKAEEIRLEGARGHPRGPALGEGAVWIASSGADTIYRVDPATRTVTRTIAAAMLDAEGTIAVEAGSVWVVTQAAPGQPETTLTRFDAATGEATAGIALPAGGAGVLASEGRVWVANPAGGRIFAIDPSTDAVAAIIQVGGAPRFLAAGHGSLWALDQRDGSVQRIDPDTGSVLARIATGDPGGPGGDIATGDGFVWAAWARRSAAAQIDPDTNAVVARFTSPGPIFSVRSGAGSIWVVGRKLFRLPLPVRP